MSNKHAATTLDEFAAMRSADKRLQNALKGNVLPVAQAEAYKHYYFERHTKLGFEALPGPDGTYHLLEFANAVRQAAEMLARGDVGFESEKARARATLSKLSTSLGYRHARGSECLWEALEAAGQKRQQAVFHEQRELFSAAALAHLTAARLVLGGTNHKVVAEVVGVFIDELADLARWMQLTPHCAVEGRAEVIRSVMNQAIEILRDYAKSLEATARRKK
jgi:hypothetical protein